MSDEHEDIEIKVEARIDDACVEIEARLGDGNGPSVMISFANDGQTDPEEVGLLLQAFPGIVEAVLEQMEDEA